MVKGRSKLALIVTGIGALSFIALEPSFVPAPFGRLDATNTAASIGVLEQVELTHVRAGMLELALESDVYAWQAEFRNDIDDIDIREKHSPVSVMPPRHRIPGKNAEVLAALGAISLDEAQSVYAEAARGNKFARAEIAKIRRKAKAVHTLPRRSVMMKRKLAWNMKEIERARKLSDAGMLSVEDARSTVARASSGSLLAQDQIRQIRQKMKRVLSRMTPQKAAVLAKINTARKLSVTGLLSLDEARSLLVRSRRGSLLAQDAIRVVRERNQQKKVLEKLHI